jgi:hypothetical protein
MHSSSIDDTLLSYSLTKVRPFRIDVSIPVAELTSQHVTHLACRRPAHLIAFAHTTTFLTTQDDEN